MTLSIDSLPIRVRAQLESRGHDASNVRNNRVLALLGSALDVIAHRVARSSHYNDLQKEFTGSTPTTGRLALPAGMIFDLARTSIRESATGTPLVPLDSPYVLRYADPPTGPVYYAQEGRTLLFRDAVGSLDTYATLLIITANYIPTLAELPADYQGLLIDTLVELIAGQHPAPRVQELSEAGRA